ncbi:MAG: putative nucleotide-binding protein [Alteromonadaceae bacterium]|jgi:predicted nucleotide-binding protein
MFSTRKLTTYFAVIRLIGRENVVAIVKGDIELPNDISGVVYIDDADWEKTLLIELRDAGYALNIANL